nr:MAG TPA: hypothetical protein [Caudoviricetes sp.]
MYCIKNYLIFIRIEKSKLFFLKKIFMNFL